MLGIFGDGGRSKNSPDKPKVRSMRALIRVQSLSLRHSRAIVNLLACVLLGTLVTLEGIRQGVLFS
jgi:hypothetical protein